MDETVVVELVVNGRERSVGVSTRESLADMLRERLGLTGTHLGCEQGVCGACTVLLDELPVRACLTLAVSCEGCEVVTVEGLHGPDVDRLRGHFRAEGGLQCGFCTPGMLVSAYDVVRRRETPTRDEICAAMSGNVCRCTGYNGIVRAIQLANDEALAADNAEPVPATTHD